VSRNKDVAMRLLHPTLILCCVVTMSCGGAAGDASTAPSNPTPVTPAPTAVASVTLTVNPPNALAGASVQLTAVTKDAQGNVLTGRAITYSSSNTAAATVSATGLVSALSPAVVTLSAASEGVSASTPFQIFDPRNIPWFDKPFAGDYPVANFFDHNIPLEFVDSNNVFVTFWGEAHPGLGGMTDGHSGYDFIMPVGTPLLAVAAGRVVHASLTSDPFFCPPLNQNVSQSDVYIEHALPGGVVLLSRYAHVSGIDVSVGQQVTAGQQIALSGNIGCTTLPHLHFEVDRVTQTRSGVQEPIDPYGWSGSAPDPWEIAPSGAASIQLWKANQAPQLWRELVLPVPANPGPPVLFTKVVFEGVNDATNPNNEYAEIALDTRVAAAAVLTGYSLRGDASGLNFPIPAGTSLSAAQPKLRIYTGSGTNSPGVIYMGRPSGVWNNSAADCAHLVFPNGFQIRIGPCS
jgi:murein DD-endopeptidase MepM/ murein hydrolase activator NlpD